MTSRGHTGNEETHMTDLQEKVREAVTPSGNGALAERVDRVKQTLTDQAVRRVRDVKRLARKGQFAFEDGVDDVALRVRKNPGKALAIAFAAGTLIGAVMTFTMRRRRTIG